MKLYRKFMMLGMVSCLIISSFAMVGCGEDKSTVAKNDNPIVETAQTTEPTLEPKPTSASDSTYGPVTVYNWGHILTFEESPQRAVSLNLHTLEIMLALGLEDRIVGTAYINAPPLPEFEIAMGNIPKLAEKYPSKEVLLGVEPDFVYARNTAFTDKGIGSVEDLMKLDIPCYAAKATIVTAATMENVYEDILNLGRIFDIEVRAVDMIESMQGETQAIRDTVGDIENPLRVLVYDFGESEMYTAGQSLETHLIGLAGGRNIFDDLVKNWAYVSWEVVVDRDPEVIVINDYGDTPAREKIEFLMNHPAMADVTAIKNEHFVILPLPGIFAGVRNPDALLTLAKGFYPDKFE
ncbi:MAG: ABC transporter substrate-binding protein [Chloroflexota bacterium]|nr:ABC transporter substrate-binding protein [Chloroflexota bacterium]